MDRALNAAKSRVDFPRVLRPRLRRTPVASASVYLVYVLEILKFRRLDAVRVRLARPEASPAEVDLHVAKHLETGEFEAVNKAGNSDAEVMGDPGAGRAEQPVGERKVDQDSVRAEDERGGTQAPVAADGR